MSGGARLWVITSYFNPMGWRRRLENYLVFRRHIGLPLVTVELGRDGRYELAESEADVMVRVPRGGLMWQKERLLNLALRALPRECEYIAWIDCDVMLENTGWADEAMRRLEHSSLVQLFDELVNLPRDWVEGAPPGRGGASVQRSTASMIRDASEAPARLATSIDRTAANTVNGFAWAARRSLLDGCGFFDRAIMGGGDTAMLGAAYGCPEAVIDLHAMNERQAERYRAWAAPFGRAAGARVAHLPGRALHLWHGNLVDRMAKRRHADLRPHEFDPDRDIALNEHGAWDWATDKPMLHEYVRGYFASRMEDGPPPAKEPEGPGRVVRLFGPFEPRILVTQHPTFRARYYDGLLQWVFEHLPEHRRLFLIRNLPLESAPWGNVVLHTAWLQDPVQAWSMETYEQERQVAATCDSMGIPVVNRMERLTNAGKLVGARLMEQAGLNVPRTALIRDRAAFGRDLLGLRPPLMVREEWGHWGEIVRAETADEARAIDLSKFRSPVATEIIDVRDPRDGLFRKYRCIVAGRCCVSHHLQVSEGWITRGDKRINTDVSRDNEMAYIGAPDPHSDLFFKAARAMGLDFVAFDYGYTPEGRMVAWEANPLPHIVMSRSALTYRNHAIHATWLAMLLMYLEAGAVPSRGAHALLETGTIGGHSLRAGMTFGPAPAGRGRR